MSRRPFQLAIACPIVAIAVVASPAYAQQAREPIGRFVVDVRGTSAGLPGDPGWTPVLPAETETPSRALGLDFGAHVYVLRFKSVAIGVGATWDIARGRTSPPDIPEGTTTPVVQGPSVTTRATSFTPVSPAVAISVRAMPVGMARDCTGTEAGQRSPVTGAVVSTVQPAARHRRSANSVRLAAASPSTMHCTS